MLNRDEKDFLRQVAGAIVQSNAKLVDEHKANSEAIVTEVRASADTMATELRAEIRGLHKEINLLHVQVDHLQRQTLKGTIRSIFHRNGVPIKGTVKAGMLALKHDDAGRIVPTGE